MLFPANMRRFESDGRVVVPHIEAANGALIVVGAQHHLAELRIALAEGVLNIKTQLVGDIVLNAGGEMGFKKLIRQRVD